MSENDITPTPALANPGDVVERVARALYEHWVAEDFNGEYCSWEALGDKASWVSRAEAAIAAMPAADRIAALESALRAWRRA